MTPAEAARQYRALRSRLASECRKHGIADDAYDADFILGVIMEWLGDERALTNTGVRRIRSMR